MNKKIVLVMLSALIFTGISAQQLADIAMRTGDNSSSGVPAGSSAPAAVRVEVKYTLDAYGSMSSSSTAFEEEHFLGGETTAKWSLFQERYKRVYDQAVGLTGSTVEIIKPTLFNAVNKINGYYKKALKKGEVSKAEVSNILNHILDCANLLSLEDDTKNIENDIKAAKSVDDMVRVFASVRIVKH
ncbi:MAG: hypothetical protein H6Q20_2605 [Bacteroidetes bacterium]|nr:hypothetical protein [Bacteroidota bacterium]